MSNKLITYKDLQSIIVHSKKLFANQNLPLSVSNIKAEYVDLTHIAMLESFIMHLNGRGMLNELIKVDYTDESTQYDAID
jgi:hypothetical protein